MQVLTKFCCFGQSMDFADNPKYVKRVTPSASCSALFATTGSLQSCHCPQTSAVAAPAWKCVHIECTMPPAALT